jgi:hypothetical protein
VVAQGRLALQRPRDKVELPLVSSCQASWPVLRGLALPPHSLVKKGSWLRENVVVPQLPIQRLA